MDVFDGIAIVILAAGSSSRMGRPKQLLKWKDKSLIRRTVETATRLSPDRTLVVLGSEWEQIKTEIDDCQVATVVNPDWEMGIGRSISEGVRYVRSNWPEVSGILIMLSDQPLIDFEHLRSLMMAHKRSNCGMVATSYSDDNFGVPAIFDSRFFDELTELNSDYGAKDLINGHCNRACLVYGYNKVVDLDTEEDYDEFLKANPQS